MQDMSQNAAGGRNSAVHSIWCQATPNGLSVKTWPPWNISERGDRARLDAARLRCERGAPRWLWCVKGRSDSMGGWVTLSKMFKPAFPPLLAYPCETLVIDVEKVVTLNPLWLLEAIHTRWQITYFSCGLIPIYRRNSDTHGQTAGLKAAPHMTISLFHPNTMCGWKIYRQLQPQMCPLGLHVLLRVPMIHSLLFWESRNQDNFHRKETS